MLTDDLSKRIDQGLRKAVRDALIRHKLLGESIAIWKDGKVVVVPAEEIEIPPLENAEDDKMK